MRGDADLNDLKSTIGTGLGKANLTLRDRLLYFRQPA